MALPSRQPWGPMRAGAAVEPNLSKVIAIGEVRMDLDRKLK
jgi:hypothetical protein